MLDETGLELEAGVVGAEVDAHGAQSCPIAPVAGVDGVPGGWVIVRVSAEEVAWAVVASAAEVLAGTADCAAVGVDIPLGLPAGPRRRACDEQTARRLGCARSSVFPAPPRAVLAAATYAEACGLARRLTGRAISVQTFQIGAKILDWDAVAPLPDGVVEVHPELSLRTLAPEVRFASKKSARGAGQRIAALARWVDPARALADLPVGARLDDVLDALAVAWSAARWAAGAAEVIGEERDARGRPMRVVV
jgi:predicted RNase H-like nuclease